MNYSFQRQDDYTQVSDADDYSSLRTYYVATPMAPPALALKIPKGAMPYMNHTSNNLNVYTPTVIPTYDELTGMALNDYDIVAQQTYNMNKQPVENVTPTPYGNNLNYNWLGDYISVQPYPAHDVHTQK